MPNIQPSNPLRLRPWASLSNRRASGELQASQLPATTPPTDDECVKGVRRVVYISLAGLFFVLGMIGIVLPGLPTTPLLLLTSFFLARSWPQMHRMLLANKLFGPILLRWQRHRAVEPRIKLQAALLVGLSITLLLFFSSLPPDQLVAVLALAFLGLFTIYWLPTYSREESKEKERNVSGQGSC